MTYSGNPVAFCNREAGNGFISIRDLHNNQDWQGIATFFTGTQTEQAVMRSSEQHAMEA